MKVDLSGVNTFIYFEAIQIIEKNNPYPTFLGIDWAFENYTMIDLKHESMDFEFNDMNFVKSLDPYQIPKVR